MLPLKWFAGAHQEEPDGLICEQSRVQAPFPKSYRRLSVLQPARGWHDQLFFWNLLFNRQHGFPDAILAGSSFEIEDEDDKQVRCQRPTKGKKLSVISRNVSKEQTPIIALTSYSNLANSSIPKIGHFRWDKVFADRPHAHPHVQRREWWVSELLIVSTALRWLL